MRFNELYQKLVEDIKSIARSELLFYLKAPGRQFAVYSFGQNKSLIMASMRVGNYSGRKTGNSEPRLSIVSCVRRRHGQQNDTTNFME